MSCLPKKSADELKGLVEGLNKEAEGRPLTPGETIMRSQAEKAWNRHEKRDALEA